MRVVGVIEMIVGLAILTRWTRIGAYVAMAWLVAIAINLVTTGMFFDLAVRDLEIAIGAYALARLTEVRERPPAASAARPPRAPARSRRHDEPMHEASGQRAEQGEGESNEERILLTRGRWPRSPRRSRRRSGRTSR